MNRRTSPQSEILSCLTITPLTFQSSPRLPRPPMRDGWICLNKPLGMSSAQAVARVKRLLNVDKIGHGGTLDPLATGVLPLALGEATKLVDWVMKGEKTYEFTIVWGASTTTDDTEGAVTATSPVRPTLEAIQGILPSFIGAIQQQPPIFSALKVKGQRAYAIAREGGVPVLASRCVTIDDLTLLHHTPERTLLKVDCGKGTYIRSLARDMALALGTVGHVGTLHRTKVGLFRIDDAISLESLDEMGHNREANVIPLVAVLDDIPELAVGDTLAQRLRHGQKISCSEPEVAHKLGDLPLDNDGGTMVCVTHHAIPVALVRVQNGVMAVIRGFNLTSI